jgi:hypothetical protein
MLTRVDTLGEELAGFIPLLPGILQPNIRVDPQGDSLLLAPKSIFDTPPLAPTGGNFEIKASFIGKLE